METAYARIRTELPEDCFSYDHFFRTLKKLENTSSPGHPFSREAPTIGEWLGFDGVGFDMMQVNRLWHMVSALMQGDDEQILTVFIKEEPHKVEKVESGRWRLIIAFPLHVQVLWHMLFDQQNDLEIENAYHLPSQQGIILNAGGWRTYLNQWRARGYDVGLDKRAWDWTVPGWLLDLDLEFRQRLVLGDHKSEWVRLSNKVYQMAFGNPILMLSDGALLRQVHPGVMKSGCVNTISSNSHMQVMVHILACEDQGVSHEPLPVCCGDDTLQCSWQATDLEAYARYGAIVKSASADLEFVGLEFTSGGPIPLYMEKHLYSLCFVKDSFESELVIQWLDSMLRYYSYSGYRQLWRDFARRLGVAHRLHSDEYYRAWYEYHFD